MGRRETELDEMQSICTSRAIRAGTVIKRRRERERCKIISSYEACLPAHDLDVRLSEPIFSVPLRLADTCFFLSSFHLIFHLAPKTPFISHHESFN